ncbi:uncharacterized protein [Nicotiana sylvestris]|uniref:uncharacterized protein n=1 Tax=Nicotiana sylvestris TaxID=4096 RepID=UPI00388C73F0
MEVYIDDMLVKIEYSKDHILHLFDTFSILRKFNMKLNPEKCAFGVASALKKQDHFEWNEECQQTLKNLKTYLSNPPLLAKPKAGERLLIYLAVSEVARMQLEAKKELQVFNGANPGTWTLFTDGSSNVKGANLGIVLIPPMGETVRQAIKCHSITNNEAEYEAVIAGLELARELGINQIIIKSDSQLMVNQMLGTYTAREARMQQYLEKVRELIMQFQTWKVIQIPRDENVEADALANLASATDVASDANASVIHLYHLVLDPDKNGKRLEESKVNWPEVLPGVLWAYRTPAKTSTGETPFSLVYGAEALITVEIGEPSTRFTQATKESSDKEMRLNLDLLEGRREAALVRMTSQKQVIERYYNRKARLRFFKIGDFVLKKDIFEGIKKVKKLKIASKVEEFHIETGWHNNLKYLEELEALNVEVPLYRDYEPCLINPSPGSFPPNLKKLTLSGTRIPWNCMKVFSKLLNLEVLELKDDAFSGDEWEITETGFPKLKFLLLECLFLKYWTATDDYFQCLERVYIRKCRHLQEIPEGFADSVTLQLIELHKCCRLLWLLPSRSRKSMRNWETTCLKFMPLIQGSFRKHSLEKLRNMQMKIQRKM